MVAVQDHISVRMGLFNHERFLDLAVRIQQIVRVSARLPVLFFVSGDDLVVRADLRITEFVPRIRVQFFRRRLPDKRLRQESCLDRVIDPFDFVNLVFEKLLKCRLLHCHIFTIFPRLSEAL